MADQIASLFVKIGADSSGVDKAMKGVKDDLTSTQKGFAAFGNVAGAAFKAVSVAAIAMGAAVVAGIGKAISAAADFEQGIADTSAAMSLSADEADDLGKHIMDLGLNPGLKVSATEAQAAIHSLGTAGLSLNQIMGGASEATVLLANATGGEFADAAALMTDVMGQYNIKAEDASRIVNQLTGLTVESKFSFNDVALAMGQVGGVAGNLGLTLEDTTAILGVTASSFDKGSDAATSLKTFLTTLVPKSAEAADVMRNLGLYTGLTGKEFEDTQGKITKLRERIAELDPTSKHYQDNVNDLNHEIGQLNATLVAGGSAFFDASGNMRSAEEIAGALQKAMGGLSEEQLTAAGTTIFGTDAMRTAFELMRAGTPAVTAYKDEVAKVDAEGMAAKRMDTFSGALEVAQGIVETFSIGIGQKFLPVLRPMVEAFSTLAATHGPKVIKFFEGLATSVGENIQKFVEWAQQVIPPLWERLTQIGIAVWKVAQQIGNAIKPVVDAIGEWVSWKDILIAVGVLLTGAVVAAIFTFMAAMAPVILLVAKVTLVIAALREAWEHNFLGIRDITMTILNNISKWLDTHTGLWKGDWGRTIDFMVNHAGEAWNEIWREAVHVFGQIKQEVMHIINTFIAINLQKWENWVGATKSKLHVMWGWFVKYFTDIKDWVGEKIQQAIDFFIPREWQEKGKAIIQGLWDGVKNIWNSFSTWFRSQWGSLVEGFKDFFGIHSPSLLFQTFGEEMMKGLGIGIDSEAGAVIAILNGMATNMTNRMNAAVATVKDGAVKIGTSLEASGLISKGTTTPAAGQERGPISGHTGGTMFKNLDTELFNVFGQNNKVISHINSFAASALKSITAKGQLQGSSAAYQGYNVLDQKDVGSASVGAVISAIMALIDEMRRRDVKSSEAALMEQLIAALRTGQGGNYGGDPSSLVAFRSGLR